MQLTRVAMLLAIIGTPVILGFPQAPSARAAQEAAVPSIPITTDDNLDPITLVFTGYAPSWWVASNIADWSDSAYCSGPKTVNGNEFNYTLEHPDPAGIACFGPRNHVRIWDMGYSPVYGQWSIGAAHHEHTVCDPLCHHVIDSWERAEADVRSAFTITLSEPNGTYTFTIGARQDFSASPSSGTINVDGAETHRTILFTVPWSTSSATVYPGIGNPIAIGFAGNATVPIPSVHLTTTAGNIGLSFNVTEIGTRGVLNITIPRAIVSSGSSIRVYVDGAQNGDTKVGGDASDLYVYFLILYGTHSVELQIEPPSIPILQYVTGGVLAASILGLLLVVFNRKKQRRLHNP